MQLAGLDANPQSAYTQGNRRPRRLVGFPRADGDLFYRPLILTLLTLLLLTSACNDAQESLQPTFDPTPMVVLPSATKEPSLTPTPTYIPSATPNPLHPPSPTRPACLDQPGTIVTGELEDPSLPQNLSFRVYLPPCYTEDLNLRYPTLYLLHGLQVSDRQWDELGVDEQADALITSGGTSPFLIVMPWQKTGVEVETTIVDVLVPRIDQIYRTLRQPAWRAIGGLSRGGGWALRIGLRHPDLFGAIGLHSPAIFFSDPYIALWVKDIPEEAMPRLWIDIGNQDSLQKSTLALIALLEELGVPYTSLMPAGDHTSEYWSSHLEDYLLWYTSGW